MRPAPCEAERNDSAFPFPLTTKITVKPYTYKKALEAATSKPLPQDVRVYLGPGESRL